MGNTENYRFICIKPRQTIQQQVSIFEKISECPPLPSVRNVHKMNNKVSGGQQFFFFFLAKAPAEDEFLDVIGTKVLQVYRLAIQCHLY